MSEYATDKEMRTEAIRRLRNLGCNGEVVTSFRHGDISLSGTGYSGNGYNAISDEMKQKIEDIESAYHVLVYHVIHAEGFLTDMDSYLVVQREKEEWRLDEFEFKLGNVFTYTVNLRDPELSEFGTIGFIRDRYDGGLYRVY